MTRGRPVLAAVLAALTGAAAGASAQDPRQQHTPDPAIADGSAQRALDRAKRTWRRTGITTYRFRVRRVCFCPPATRGPVTLTVRRGRPVRAPDEFGHVATLPRLHRVVREAIAEGAAELDVRYDRRGIPVEVFVDSRRRIIDEETGYAVDRFRRG
ncbi:MAG TPA: DUF6174 domain-containing protein [Baekduia sp.]|nr:DUF6174 domain-containing protein [Baekduia sp.]